MMKTKSLVVLCGLVAAVAGGGAGAHAQAVYQGRAVIAVAVLDPLSGQPVKQDSFQHDVQVVVDDPAVTMNGQQEPNPFNLAINPIGTPTLEGQFGIFSAIPFRDPNDPPGSPDFLIQYWQLQQNGPQVNGQLVNSHAQEALAINLLNSIDLTLLQVGIQFVSAFAMIEGTTLQGTIDGNEVRLVLRGNTIDTFHPFEAEIAARRFQ